MCSENPQNQISSPVTGSPKEIPIISVIGWSGTGKTTLITLVMGELSRRNIRTAAFKQIHKEVYNDREGSDSRLFFEAGARGVGLGTPGGALLFMPDYRWTAAGLRALFYQADLILCEGLVLPGVPVLQTAGSLKRPADLKGFSGDWSFVLTDDLQLSRDLNREGIQTLPQSDIRPACAFLEGLCF